MKYREIADGIFLDRPNRFIAHVNVNGVVETVHVKNTPGGAENCCCPVRRCVWKCQTTRNARQNTTLWRYAWVNMDSQAPNKVVGEWLSKQEFDLVRPEFAFPSCNFMIAASIIQALGKCVKSVLYIAAI